MEFPQLRKTVHAHDQCQAFTIGSQTEHLLEQVRLNAR